MSINELTTKATHSAVAGTLPRVLRTLSDGFAALTAGSRAIPMGDNGDLLRDLASRSAQARHQCSWCPVP